jgi:hypothetical protein
MPATLSIVHLRRAVRGPLRAKAHSLTYHELRFRTNRCAQPDGRTADSGKRWCVLDDYWTLAGGSHHTVQTLIIGTGAAALHECASRRQERIGAFPMRGSGVFEIEACGQIREVR